MRVEFEPIVTARLRLRRSRPEDAEAISRYRSDPEVQRFQGWDRTDVEGVREEILEMASRAPGDPGGWVQLTVVERGSGELVGDVGLSSVEGEPGTIKIGYTIAPERQGRGFGTEAVGALVDLVLGVLGADVVRIHASADNVASIRLAEKLGFRFVRRFEHRDGDEVWSVVRYERTRET